MGATLTIDQFNFREIYPDNLLLVGIVVADSDLFLYFEDHSLKDCVIFSFAIFVADSVTHLEHQTLHIST